MANLIYRKQETQRWIWNILNKTFNYAKHIGNHTSSKVILIRFWMYPGKYGNEGIWRVTQWNITGVGGRGGITIVAKSTFIAITCSFYNDKARKRTQGWDCEQETSTKYHRLPTNFLEQKQRTSSLFPRSAIDKAIRHLIQTYKRNLSSCFKMPKQVTDGNLRNGLVHINSYIPITKGWLRLNRSRDEYKG